MQFCVLASSSVIFSLVICTLGFNTNPYDNKGHEEAYEKLNTWDPPKNFKKDFPYYLSGYDYEGRPVWVFNFWKWNIKKLLGESETIRNKFEKYCEQFRFRIYNSPKYAPHNLNKTSDVGTGDEFGWVFLVNLDGYDLKQLINYPTFKKLYEILRKLEIAGDNLDYGFFINTNFFAESFINTLKPILGRTLGKIDIRGTSKRNWLPAVLKSIPRESLPEEFGGFSNHTEIIQ